MTRHLASMIIAEDSARSYMAPHTLRAGFRVGTLAKAPSNLNPERMLGGCLPHRMGTQSKGHTRCDGMISAASTEGDGRTPRGGDTPVLTLLYAVPEAGASAERHILHALISGTFLKNRAKSVQYRSDRPIKAGTRKPPIGPSPLARVRSHSPSLEITTPNIRLV
jgi:hypothetical protein